MGKKTKDVSKEMSEDQKIEVEKELEAKNTGFDTPHAKQQFQTSPFKPTNAVEGFGDENFLPGKDPQRSYKLIDFIKFRNGGYRDTRGWVPLTMQTLTTEQFPDPGKSYGANVASDGFWHIGDRIWAFMPREQYMQQRHTINLRTEKRVKSINNKMKQTAGGLKSQGYGNVLLEGE